MSKKHFIALADYIREYNARHNEIDFIPFTPAQLSVLASFCRSQNPAFLAHRWLAYIRGECGPSGGAR